MSVCRCDVAPIDHLGVPIEEAVEQIGDGLGDPVLAFLHDLGRHVVRPILLLDLRRGHLDVDGGRILLPALLVLLLLLGNCSGGLDGGWVRHPHRRSGTDRGQNLVEDGDGSVLIEFVHARRDRLDRVGINLGGMLPRNAVDNRLDQIAKHLLGLLSDGALVVSVVFIVAVHHLPLGESTAGIEGTDQLHKDNSDLNLGQILEDLGVMVEIGAGGRRAMGQVGQLPNHLGKDFENLLIIERRLGCVLCGKTRR